MQCKGFTTEHTLQSFIVRYFIHLIPSTVNEHNPVKSLFVFRQFLQSFLRLAVLCVPDGATVSLLTAAFII